MPGGTQGLLLAMYLVITPGSARVSICCAENQIKVGRIQGKHLSICTSFQSFTELKIIIILYIML